jgi:uncharacterized membrane protein
MSEEGYGITIFRPGTPQKDKTRGIVFFIIFCVIILIQACYWLFANSAKPIIIGLPFGMFFVVLFIAIEFAVLLTLYLLEFKDTGEEE